MEVLYLLVPLAAILAGVIVWAFLWSIRSGRFEGLEARRARGIGRGFRRPGIHLGRPVAGKAMSANKHNSLK